MSTFDAFDDEPAPPPAAALSVVINPRLAQADAMRRGNVALMDGHALSEREVANVNEQIAEYAKERPGRPDVTAALRRMPAYRALQLLQLRWRLQTSHGRTFKPDAEPHEVPSGVRQEPIDGIRPDLDSKGQPRVCMLCGGVRWMRVTNYGPGEVEVEIEKNVRRIYGAGETWVVPCAHCSARREDRIRAAARRHAAGKRKVSADFTEEIA